VRELRKKKNRKQTEKEKEKKKRTNEESDYSPYGTPYVFTLKGVVDGTTPCSKEGGGAEGRTKGARDLEKKKEKRKKRVSTRIKRRRLVPPTKKEKTEEGGEVSERGWGEKQTPNFYYS